MNVTYYHNNLKLLFLMMFLYVTYATNASTLPGGFAEVRLASGLDPTGIELAADGRLFITIKSGKVLVYKNNTLLSTPLLDISVDNTNERGIQSIVLDPGFSSNGYFYVYYAVPGANHNRVSRFTAVGDVAETSSEFIVIELDPLAGSVHNGGSMFFKGGKIFITTGEGSDANKAQSLTSLLGKVLRLNPDGTIPSDNPLMSSTSGKYQSIYALGFRNPFRASIQPGTGRVFVNDVGNSTWEEINDLLPGKNYGWPTIEGKITTQTAPANYMDPVYAYSHSNGCSITGGAFYNPTTGQFPSQYVGKYFFQDYCGNYIKVLDLSTYAVTETFATGLNRPIDIEISSDGSLYYIARGGLGGGSQQDNTSSSEGEVWKVNYTGSGQPSIAAQPANTTVVVGGSTSFVVSASGNAPLTYQWQKNGVNISGATSSTYAVASASLSDDGAVFSVVVTNGLGTATSNGAVLTVINDALPVPTITLPATGAKYNGGQIISFAGTGTDTEDGDLPASAFTWEILLFHDSHNHPAYPATTGSKSGTFTVPTSGETSSNVWFRIYLTVKDSKNQTIQIYRDVFPNKADVTLATDPAGLSVKLDGTSIVTPYTFTGVVGIIRSIEAVSPQTSGSTTYQFTGWSDSGAIMHNITTLSSNTTYTASFSAIQAGTGDGLKGDYYNNKTLTSPIALTRTDGTVNFNWGTGSYATSQPVDNFSARWTGLIQPKYAETYTFETETDDGVRLWVNDVQIINSFIDQSPTKRTGTISLTAGTKYNIKMEYYENGGGAVAKLRWSSASQVYEVIPQSQLFSTSGCTAQGKITYQKWNGITGTPVSDLTSNANYPNTPSITSDLTSFEASTNVDDNYGARIAGYICAPQTGGYTFWIAGDDNVELWLSTNNQASGKVKIASHTGWTNAEEWNKYSTQKSAVINLTVGQSYYVEALMKEAKGGDNLAVGWRTPNDGAGTVPTEVIPGSLLSPLGSTVQRIATSEVSEVAEDVVIYPNPTTGEFQIEFVNEGSADVIITDPTGQSIVNFKRFGTINEKIKLSNHSNGLYLLKIQNSKGVKTKKIVISK